MVTPPGLSADDTKHSVAEEQSSSDNDQNTTYPTAAMLIFDAFVEKMSNGNASQIVGVYVDEIMALKVVQQPIDDPIFISPLPNTALRLELAFGVSAEFWLGL